MPKLGTFQKDPASPRHPIAAIAALILAVTAGYFGYSIAIGAFRLTCRHIFADIQPQFEGELWLVRGVGISVLAIGVLPLVIAYISLIWSVTNVTMRRIAVAWLAAISAYIAILFIDKSALFYALGNKLSGTGGCPCCG